MKYLSILSSGFLGLLLLGAGCAVTTSPDVAVGDIVVEDAVVVEQRMVKFHNNYVPTFDMMYDANMFNAGTGSGVLIKEATNDFLNVNDAVVTFTPVDAVSPKLADASLVMMFVNGDVTREQIQAALGTQVASSIDAEVAGFDAHVFTMNDGSVRTAWPTSKGYYLLTVNDAAAQSIADSLTF
jgi:hypothetical protein